MLFKNTNSLPGAALRVDIFDRRGLGNEEGAEAIQSALFAVLRHLRAFEEEAIRGLCDRETIPGSRVTNHSQCLL